MQEPHAWPALEARARVRIARSDNPLLSRVDEVIRKTRPATPSDLRYVNFIEDLPGGAFLQVWFLTGGCRWDACTMCDYGRGPRISGDDMVRAVEDALGEARNAPITSLFVSPSGSMLDPGEVPRAARRRIFSAMRSLSECRMFIVETRAETVTAESLGDLREAFAGRAVGVELGLESSDPWVLRNCVNKGGLRANFQQARSLIAASGFLTIANVCLGTPFLSRAEAIEDAVNTATWAAREGADEIVLFPLHVKPHTTLAALHRLGLYEPVSLWDLGSALAALSLDVQQRTTIAWYRNRPGTPTDHSPTTCPACVDRALHLLDAYRGTSQRQSIEALAQLECTCRRPITVPRASRVERLLYAYEKLAEVTNLTTYWASLQRDPSWLSHIERDE